MPPYDPPFDNPPDMDDSIYSQMMRDGGAPQGTQYDGYESPRPPTGYAPMSDEMKARAAQDKFRSDVMGSSRPSSPSSPSPVSAPSTSSPWINTARDAFSAPMSEYASANKAAAPSDRELINYIRMQHSKDYASGMSRSNSLVALAKQYPPALVAKALGMSWGR